MWDSPLGKVYLVPGATDMRQMVAGTAEAPSGIVAYESRNLAAASGSIKV